MAWQGRTTGQGSTRASRHARDTCLTNAHHQCQLRYPGCTRHATHADHRINIATTGQSRAAAVNPDDLQAACEWCHGIKTRTEATAARNAWKRRPQKHPGLK